LSGSESVQVYLLYVYICTVIGDPIIRGGGGWYLMNHLNPYTFLCLSEARIPMPYINVILC